MKKIKKENRDDIRQDKISKEKKARDSILDQNQTTIKKNFGNSKCGVNIFLVIMEEP